MYTYFALIPFELVSSISENLDKYNSIISFSKLLNEFISNNSLENIFKGLFAKEYEPIYSDIDKVIKDDIYLNNNIEKLPNYVVLYAISKDTYKNNISDPSIVKSIDDLIGSNVFDNILYRAIFNKLHPDMYIKIKELESFNFDGLYNTLARNKLKTTILTNYWYYGLYYNLIYNLVNKNDYSRSAESQISDLYENLLYQDNGIKILEILIQDEDIKQYFIDTPLEVTIGMVERDPYRVELSNKQQELFKFIYKNKLVPSEEYTWEYLLNTIRHDNYDLFIWMLKNGEKTWVDNPEFEDEYETVKEEMGEDYDFSDYDKALELYKKKN